jgi:hypothetical protein
MAHIGHHPAPGLGELVPGSFVVPSNPVVSRSYIPHIGDLLPGSFVVPQNPLIAAVSSPPGYGMPNSRPLGVQGHRGMGELGAFSDLGCTGGMCGGGMGLFEDPTSLALLIGAGVVVMWMLSAPGGREYHEGRRKLKQTYERQVQYLKAKSRGYRRVARETAGALVRGAEAAHAAVK